MTREERDMQAPFNSPVPGCQFDAHGPEGEIDWDEYEDWDESLDESEDDYDWDEYDEDVERDWMLAQQELEDFEQADEYFGGGCEYL